MMMGRMTLPAIEIARKFVDERDKKDRDFEFVLFLDRDAATNGARRATEDEFCDSVKRSRSSLSQ